MRHRTASAPALVAMVALVALLLPAGGVVAAEDIPTVPGLFAIDQAPATASPDVVLRLTPPTTSDGLVRISNDGTAWREVTWSATVPWSLIDPTAGGVDEDGSKLVWLDYGDGAAWHARGQAGITLDRSAPVITGADIRIGGQLWQGSIVAAGAEPGDSSRYSLDGSTWSSWQQDGSIDIWAAPGGGTWASGDRSVQVQVRDLAGNESNVVSAVATVDAPVFAPYDDPYNKVAMSFELPNPMITGQPFTIRPIYPPGYVKPAKLWCEWSLHWGDDESIMGPPNPTWGELIIERPKTKNGACDEWTFTVPNTPSRQFSWMFQMGTKEASADWEEWTEGLYSGPNGSSQVFRAALGSSDPRFLTSTIPFAYLLPETTISQKGDPVTYRLHTVGTTTVPQTGMFWTYPIDCYINPQWSQVGGTTYTYRPTCDGPWVTGWTGTMLGGYMRSQYDPLVDGRAPYLRAPSITVRTAGFGSSVPATISWGASDSGSGVYAYQLQVSRNGGTWTSIALPSRLTRSVARTLALSGTYRFRARARDRVGNWSSWVAGPAVSAAAYQETSTATHWSGPWALVADPAFSGGKAKAATAAGTTARVTTTARSLAWVTRKGPGRGLAQVWLDGVKVATIDLRAAALSGRQVVFSKAWSTAGTHSLVVKPLGTATGPLVEADAFLAIR